KEAADIAESMNAFCVHSMAPLMVLQNVEDSATRLECGAFVHEYIARNYLKVFNYQPKKLAQLSEEADDPKMRKEISALREQMVTAEIEISLLISQIPRSQAPKFEFK
ncbi:MAG: hypothetical protein IT423_14895, partial [Pirellulaceae bacterium]|nr:hypothetical protein [Pirellulaceae bacterium]